jgi:uncharacterized membrane protein YccC
MSTTSGQQGPEMRGDSRPFWLEDKRRPDIDVWKIAIGVASGFLIAGAIAFVARIWLVNQALGEFNKTIATIGRQTNEQMARERDRQERERAAAAEQEAFRRASDARKQRAQEDALREAQERRFAKDQAWNRYYQRPAGCDTAEGKAFVDCANHHIRAKRQFEELWAAGKL